MKLSEYVSKYDPQNQFDVLINTYSQIEFVEKQKIDLSIYKGNVFTSIVVAGLGGSAISGDLLLNFLKDELKVPLVVNRGYNLPLFADQNTFVIASSYSGNTEETISVMKQALKKGCAVAALSTGGKVREIAKESNVPLLNVKPGYQPRYTLGLSFFSLLKILHEAGFIKDQSDYFHKVKKLWKSKAEEYGREDGRAYKIAEQLIGYIPVIYSDSEHTSAAGYRLKCQFNENSKLHAFHNVIPEMNHNEIIGWESFAEKQFNTKTIMIIDKSYHPQVKKRFEICAGLINTGKIYLESDEEDLKLRLMDLIFLGDWISYILALLRGFDPTEIDNINYLKEKLT